MKNVVVVMQQVNWEDGGGDHDPQLKTVDDALFAELEKYSSEREVHPDGCDLLGRLRACPSPTLPCTLHGVFNVWHEF